MAEKAFIEDIVPKISSTRCVGIEIANATKSLTLKSPKTFCESGYNSIPPAPTIHPGETRNCVFVKKQLAPTGSVGLLTYDCGNLTLCLMFSNPFDYNLYDICYALYIYKDDMQYSGLGELYKEMYYKMSPNKAFARAQLSKSAQSLELHVEGYRAMATMSNDCRAILKLRIEDE
ncbi:uncharacterized protein LOC144767797 [Lissotriton helveticus]